MKVTVLVVGAALSLSGCGAFGSLSSGASSPFSGMGGMRGSQSEIEGIRFRTRVSAVSEDKRGFTTMTRGAARNLTAAAEAGRVEAVEYCIRRFGGSEIIWTAGPDREPEQMPLDTSGALVLAGACVTR
ncbi:hypothetical protein SAMN05444004_105137 [Jannaschia faecimaris]|uniref:DUF4156 domain-containing protein n=1 Tax=Jannaschia faecimaris TaxID=1244108 RepID=A0A1H3PSI2_9RHOB|nr:hypothetical protein [Jannaschia faecimaris]SDZ03931.1 hypothetical protein SAMN05444004_105137 [Jannaschia faecimaris]